MHDLFLCRNITKRAESGRHGRGNASQCAMGGGASKAKKKAPIVDGTVTTGAVGTEISTVPEDAEAPGHSGQLHRAQTMEPGKMAAELAAEMAETVQPRRQSDTGPGGKRKTRMLLAGAGAHVG